jgi:hypothetical protein
MNCSFMSFFSVSYYYYLFSQMQIHEKDYIYVQYVHIQLVTFLSKCVVYKTFACVINMCVCVMMVNAWLLK